MSSTQFQPYDFENPSFLERFVHGILMPAFGGKIFYKPFYKKLSLKGSEHVLDFGCGSGTGSRYLAQALNEQGQLICLDTSSYWLNKAERQLVKHKNIRFVNMDIQRAQINNESIDAVAIRYVLHDIPPDNREETVRKIGEKMKRRGKLIIWEPTAISHGIPPDEIKKLMEAAGLYLLWQEPKRSSWQGGFVKK